MPILQTKCDGIHLQYRLSDGEFVAESKHVAFYASGAEDKKPCEPFEFESLMPGIREFNSMIDAEKRGASTSGARGGFLASYVFSDVPIVDFEGFEPIKSDGNIIINAARCHHLSNLEHLQNRKISKLVLISCDAIDSLASCPDIGISGSTSLAYSFGVGEFNISYLQNLTTLKGFCDGNKNRKLGKIDIGNTNVTSLEGISEEVYDLNIENTKIESFEYFPKDVHYLKIDLKPGILMKLHQLIHEEKRIKSISLSVRAGSVQISSKMIESLTEVSKKTIEIQAKIMSMKDPFEFQDWCVDNDFVDYL
jgi:hypothetical protein